MGEERSRAGNGDHEHSSWRGLRNLSFGEQAEDTLRDQLEELRGRPRAAERLSLSSPLRASRTLAQGVRRRLRHGDDDAHERPSPAAG